MRNARPLDAVNTQPTRTFSRLKLYAAVLAASQWMASGQVWAAPEGGQVVGGEGVIQHAGVETIITQATERMAIDWRSFDVAANERVEFIQPNSSSIALNRVLSNRGSEILGRIDANGQVMLVNANGVVFSKDSVINVGGMIASGLNIDPASFINGDFALNSIDGAEGKVINYGIINAATGGSVTLVGEQVRNDGLISAKLGAVNLVAGNAAVLTFDPSGMVGVRVTDAVVQDELGVDAAVINNGTINAEAGRVLLSASVSEDVFSNAVNNAGMNKSSSVVVHDDGSFTLGAGADLINTGDISVSTSEGNAGQVVALGNNITHSGSISADTTKGAGGSIELHSTDKTLVTQNAKVSAQATAQGEGGDVKVLGNKVGLFDHAEVNASGANGGGQVLIGGDKTGDNKKIRNADFIYLGENTAVKTDALVDGNGGKLITFASDTARIYGNLYSRGGSEGGNGGFIETSGLKGFEILKAPDMGASLGLGGTWLIDPYNITIGTADEDGDGFPVNSSPFGSTSNSTLSITSVRNALLTGNVTVQTGSGGNASDGWIKVESQLDYSGATRRELTLSAHNGIVFTAGMNANVNLVLNADFDGVNLDAGNVIPGPDGVGGGHIKITSVGQFTTRGGSFSASGVNFLLQDNGDLGIETGGGSVTLNMKGSIDILSNVLTTNGNFSATGTSFNAHNPNSTVINTGTGNLTITANSTVELGDIDTNDLAINADGNFSVAQLQAGNVTVNQVAGTKLTVAGTSTFNTHVANSDNTNIGGDINLSNAGNIFTGDLIFKNTGNVTLTDSTAVNLGQSNINGFFTLISNGNVTQTGSGNRDISVSGITTITASDDDIILNNSQNKFNTVNFTNAIKSLDLLDSEANLVVGEVNTSKTNVNGGSIKITNTASGGALTVDTLTTAGGAAAEGSIGKNGGSVTLFADGAVSVGNINSSGSSGNDNNDSGTDEYDGGSGGNVSITSTSASVSLAAISADGGNGDADDSGNNDDADGGNAGSISVKGTEIELKSNLFARGGRLEDYGTPDKNNGLGGAILLDGNVRINNSLVKIDSTLVDTQINGSETRAARPADITVTGNIVGETSHTNALEINSAQLTFGGTVGDVSKSLGDLTINSTNFVGATGKNIYVKSLSVDSAGFSAGDISTYRAGENAGNITINATGLVSVGAVNAKGDALTDDGGVVEITGTSVTVDSIDTSGNNAGSITVEANNSSSPKNITVNGDLNANNTGTGQSTVQLTLANTTPAGTVNLNSGSYFSSNITVTGSGTADALKALNTDNTWDITTVANAGTITKTDNTTPKTITFTGFENITGGSGVDTFNLGHNITSSVNGGLGADIFNINVASLDAAVNGGDHNDVFFINVATTKLALNGNDGEDIFNIINIGNVEATLAGGNGRDIINSADRENTWVLGESESLNKSNVALGIGFSEIEDIRGSVEKDSFSFVGTRAAAGTIDADAASVTNSLVDEVTVLTDGTINFSTGNSSFSAVQNVEVLRSTGGGKLKVESDAGDDITWTFGVDNIVAEGTKSVTFLNFTSYEGGAGNDIFSIQTATPFEGVVDGGAGPSGGSNRFEVSSSIGAYSIAVGNQRHTGSSATLANIQDIRGNDSTSLRLTSGTNAWNITAKNAGEVGAIGFTGISSIIGASASDSLRTSFNGDVDWSISGTNKGTLTTHSSPEQLIAFDNLGNLDGSIFNDKFSFLVGSSIVSAEGGGGTGTDTADFSALAARTITIGAAMEFSFTGVERFEADASKDFTLAASSAETWTIDNRGGIDGKVGNIEFVGFKNLQGSTGNDIFDLITSFGGIINAGDGNDNFEIRSAYTGNLQGGNDADTFAFFDGGSVMSADAGTDAGTDTSKDVVNLSNLGTDQVVTINGSTLYNVANIERVVGRDDAILNFTLTTSSATNTWRIFDFDGAGTLADFSNDGSVAGIEFVNFRTLRGGTGVDEFTFDTNFTGTVEGLGGDDTFNIKTALTGTLLGGDGADTFALFDGGSVVSADAGTDAGTDTSKDVVNLSNLGTDQVVTINGSTLYNVANIERVVGNDSPTAANFTLATSSATNTWRIFDFDGAGTLANFSNDGSVAGIEFVNFRTLRGGTGVDEFTFDTNFTSTVEGLGGDDTFNIKTALTGTLLGGDGADTFALFDGGSVVSADAGTDAGTDTSKDVVNLSNLGTDQVVTINGSTLYNVANIERVVGNDSPTAANFTLATSSATNTWRIFDFDGAGTLANFSNDGSVAGIEFVNFRTLRGGTGVDEFTFDTNFTGTVEGLGGDDTFNIKTALTGTLLGGDGADTFALFDGGSVVSADAGTDAGTDTSKDVVNLSNLGTDQVVTINGSTLYNVANIERVVGNDSPTAANFTLATSSATNTWRIFDFDGAGTLANFSNDGSVAGIEFVNFRTLRGGTGVDEFTFDTNFTGTVEGLGGDDTFNIKTALTGTLLGGDGADTFALFDGGSVVSADAGTDAGTDTSKDVVNLSNLGTDQVVTINGSTLYNVANIERVVGNDSPTAANFTLATSSATNTWRIFDFDGAGTLANFSNDGSVAGIEFVNFRTLRGGTGVDEFTFDTNFTGTVEGLGGDDTFNIKTALTGTLLGGDGADTFALFDGGSVVSADAGTDAGTDTSKDVVNLSKLTTDQVVTINGSTLFNVANIERVVGNASANRNFTLTASSVTNTWRIFDFDGAGTLADFSNDGSVAGIEFVNFNRLQGGAGVDEFTFDTDFTGTVEGLGGDDIFNIKAALTGTLLGGDGADTFVFDGGSLVSANAGTDESKDVVDLSKLTTDQTVFINGSTLYNVASIERVVGNADGNFTLTSLSVGPTAWTIQDFDDAVTLADGVNDGTAGNVEFINFKNLVGGSGEDTFTFVGTRGVIQSIDGGGGANTLIGRNAANIWLVDGENRGNVSIEADSYVESFSRIQNLTGGTGNDEFYINGAIGNVLGNDGNDQFLFNSIDNTGSAKLISGGNGDNQIIGRNSTNIWSITNSNAGNVNVSVTNSSPYIANFNGIQTLIGGNLADVFKINADITGIFAGAGDNVFEINTEVDELVGGDNNDQFIFGNNGRANSIKGGLGTNSLYARNAQNTWTITSANAGNIQANNNDNYVDNFSSIQVLQGGTGADSFIINAAAEDIYGNGGDDTFVFISSNGGTAKLINGGGDADVIQGRSQANIWSMTGSNSGSVAVTNSAPYVSSFVNIKTLLGGSFADTLVANNQANSWTIKLNNAGTLHATGTPLQSILFEGMENLLGGQGVDAFTFEANGYITGLIDGGTSASRDAVKDTLNLSAITGNVAVRLGNQNSSNLDVHNVEEILASGTNWDNHVITGAGDVAYRWTIDGDNTGIIQTLTAPLFETSVRFVNFGDIRGGDNNDRFDVQATVTKSIDGGGGTNLVDYSRRVRDFTIELGGSSGLGITGIRNVQGVVGNSDAGTGFTSTIKVNSADNDWTIGTQDTSLGDGRNDGNISVGNTNVTFENFTNLIGGSGRDTFKYLANGGWFGNIDGGGGTNNTIDASASTRNQQLHVNGAQAGVTNLNNINELIGNSATDSRLVGTLSTNTWLVGASNGTLNASLKFSGIANLQGGADIDTFTISNLSWLTGVIDGGGESDTLDLTGMRTAITLAIDSQTQADINIVNVESINANNGFANTLIGSVNGNEWRIDEINAGVLNKTISFTGFGNLTGSANVDQIIFANNIADLTGHLDMGAGQDVLDLSASGRAMTVQLNSSKAPLANGVISVNAIEELKGAANQSNHLIADNYSNTWVIDAIDAGRVSSAETGTTTFTQFNRLTGGSLDDKFDFEALGKTTGLVDGGAESTGDIVDLSKSLSANVKIASTGETTGFVNIEKYIGNSIDSTLTAADLVNNWSLSGNNSGTLNGVVEFENFGILKGGNSKDNFMITDATISGSIDSGDGDDTFDIQSSAIAGKIKAGSGNDSFTFTILPGAQGTATIEGGDGTNSLTIAGGDANYKVTHQIGRQEYTDASNNTYSILSSQINNIIDNLVANSLSILGTTAADSFRLQNARYSTNNLDTVYYTNKSNLIVNGSADDRVIVDGTLGIESTVTFNNVSVGAENAGRIQARSLELVNTGDVGSASARLNTAVTDLSLSATNGSIFLEEQDNLLLKNFSVSTTNTVDLKVGSNLTTLNPLAYTGALNIESLRGNVELGENNLLSGLLNLRANGDILLGNSQTLNIGDLTAQNANLSSGASIKANGIFWVSGKTSLNAVNDITLLNSANDINQVTITKADAAEIFDRNGFITTGMTIVNTLNLRSSGNITVNTSCITDCANSYGVNTKNLKIQSDGVVTVAKNISATDTLTIDAQGITVNDAITSKQFLMSAGNGKLLLNESGSLLGQGGNSISLIANSLEQYSTVISNGNITATINGDVIMNDRALMESLSANVELSARNMQLSQVKATNGSVVMNAQGSIVDGNGSAANIVAGFWKADAINGIGSGIGQVSGFDAIETDVDRLSIRNAGDFNTAGQGSNINIANTGALVIEQLRNNGSITLSNANGNVVLDNTNNEKFDITNPDARVQGGVINANTGNASQLILSVDEAMILAANKPNKQNPDIIADAATVRLGEKYSLGEANRKIVLHVPEYYAQNNSYSSKVWHIRRPKVVIDLSKIPPDSFVSGRDQLIQIEELSEIDPAIFTNLRNYVHDEVAILLPSDQRFDSDEETGTYLGQY